MLSQFELILLAVFIGVTVSKTTLIERLKMWMLDNKMSLITKALDCPLCSSFWSSILLNVLFFNGVHDFIVNASASALLGYFIGKD